jgi:peptidoglycan-N-acetylglucosamine deacetylase
MKYRNILFLLFPLTFLSCNEVYCDKGAVVFTFDDQFVQEWYDFRHVFKQYNIKATFFISHPHLLDSNQIGMLKTLEKDGHEIACHGMNHFSIADFQSIDLYIIKEVLPAYEILIENEFNIKSFAYPYGVSNDKSDIALSDIFKYLRKGTWTYKGKKLESYDEIYASKNSYRIVNSMGIDSNYDISIKNLIRAFKRAKSNDEALILYAHKIDYMEGKYKIHSDYLKQVFELSNEYNLNSIRVCDLEDYFLKSENL